MNIFIYSSLDVLKSKIRPIRAPIPCLIVLPIPENPAKPFFSVRVENTLKYRFDWQNTADLHLSNAH